MKDNTADNQADDDATDELAEDMAYEHAIDMIPGMTGMESSVIAHILSAQEENQAEDTPTAADETLDRERALAVQKGLDSARPKPSIMG